MYLINKTQIFNTENNVLLAPTRKIYKMINSDHYSFLVTDINGVDYTCVLLETAHKIQLRALLCVVILFTR